jgi:trans-aconitate methyltransferase
MTLDRRDHWNRVYLERSPGEVSWFEARPSTSLALIERAGVDPAAGAIDVGAGASPLAGLLREAGYGPLAVLDVSGEALRRLRSRLGERAAGIEFIESDVTRFQPTRRYGVWHDRAVFHFLTDEAEQRAYLDVLERSLQPGGVVVMATFAPDGPTRCSGLDVQRHDATSLEALLGAEFARIESRAVLHRTPTGVAQRFGYHLFRRA